MKLAVTAGLFSVMLALFLLPALLYPAIASASGGTIEVSSSDYKVDFPRSVIFHLEAESQAEIVEIKLYYSLPGSRAKFYGYPSFQPGKTVEAVFDLETSGASYLPPGALLEYYYVITDAEDNTFKTQPAVFTYLDTRFQWNVTTIGPLKLLWHNLPSSRVERVAGEVEQKLDNISQILALQDDVEPFVGVIYNSRREALPAFPSQSATITREQVFQGYAFSQSRLFVGVGLSSTLVSHEAAHLMLDDYMQGRIGAVPTWLNEGFASYMQGSSYSSRGVESGSLPLRSMRSMPGRPQDIRLFYGKSESVVRYMLETHGPRKFRTFLTSLKQSLDLDKALIDAYGFDVNGLEQRWQASLSGQPLVDQVPSLFQNFTSLLIGALAVITAALLGLNLTVRRLRRKPAMGEGYLDEGEEDEEQ